jgi:hypothetical protein
MNPLRIIPLITAGNDSGKIQNISPMPGFIPCGFFAKVVFHLK